MNFGSFTHRRPRRPPQDGYLLLAILVMVFLMSLALMAAATSVAQQNRRDREEEMIHRGAQYARAVKKYFTKFHTYPNSLDALENTNTIRFLRQRYKDPMSPTGEWHLVHYGEVQLGQTGAGTLGGSPAAPAGGTTGQTASAFGQTGAAGQNPGATSAFSGPATQGSGTSGTFGGGPILGVSSTSEKQGIREFNGKSHYNQWMFVYDQTTDRPGVLITGPYQPLKNLLQGTGVQTMGQQPSQPAQQPAQPTFGTPIQP